MRVFVTGATGLLGFAIVNELVAAGHQVTGLARSDASAKKLADVGAANLRGDIENLDVLRAGAANADGVIHTAFYHQISHIPLGTRLRVFLGGLPTAIVGRFLQAALDADRRALETMGGALQGSGRPLVGTFGTMQMQAGKVATEDEAYDPNSAGAMQRICTAWYLKTGRLALPITPQQNKVFRSGRSRSTSGMNSSFPSSASHRQMRQNSSAFCQDSCGRTILCRAH